MLPLRVVFLWHYHQPEYRWEGNALLPWTRLRAVKDYATVFQRFAELPQWRCVLNVVPSLLLQLTAYATGELSDTAEQSSLSPAAVPSEDERRYWSWVQPPEVLLRRFPTAAQLWRDGVAGVLEPAQWVDLRMWAHLLWMFPHRQRFPLLREWFQRGNGFQPDEVRLAVQLQRLLVWEAVAVLRELVQQERMELSCSPLYHPVVPLVCDTDALRESDPELPLLEPAFRFPEDAWLQCVRARQVCWEVLGVVPRGMWAPEAAVSMAALQQMVAAGVQWAATDETQLLGSVPGVSPLQKYLPHRITTPVGELVLFFRDRQLSDAIGFVYGDWEPERAVEDFCQRLHAIRAELVRAHGEEVLQTAAVLVALDGENCWDAYPDNGVAFLGLLAERLHAEEGLTMATCRDVLAAGIEMAPQLTWLRAGSWVEGSLRIWAGTERHRAAWTALRQVREQVEAARWRMSPTQWRRALEHILIAEGSDWFWWLSPERPTPAAPLFEQLFQLHLVRAQELIGTPAVAVHGLGATP
jgi:alpha-amylase/alpha-mannosidase (GH57 family)